MTLVWLVVGGVLLWGLVFTQLDRPSVPAWQSRNGYRLLSVLFFALLLVISAKAFLWHQELRQCIAGCP